MFFYKTNYQCTLSEITFSTVVDFLNSEPEGKKHKGHEYMFFIDVDSCDIIGTIKMIHNFSRKGNSICVIAFISEGKTCPPEIKQVSDIVVDKKIKYDVLAGLLKMLISAKPKGKCATKINNVYSKLIKSSEKEEMVLKLLVDGHSHSEIADMLHISIKTVSGYKMKAIKRYGAKNFNQLYMQNARGY
ncbi:TPA: helix-turn-helix transcriptional regulator [Raoultella ornithinolytica]|nr:helix-turn-helix transcriptional regulator [Raoultella ornithinolytica]